MKQLKGGKKKLPNTKNLVKHFMRGEVLANWNDLVVNCWSPKKLMYLYRGVSRFFAFPCLSYDKRRRYDTMLWNTHFNMFMERRGTLYVEQLWFRLMVKWLVHPGKIFIIIIKT